MGKRKPTLTDEWLNDFWNVRGLDYGAAELKDFDRLVSSAVARCLEGEDRAEVAATLSYILGESVTANMLNAYASEARNAHRIPASRFLALMAMTRRFDLLDAVLREIGGKAVDRHGAKIFRVGKSYVASVNAARVLREEVAELYTPFEP